MANKIEAATTIDIMISCLVPFWGLLIGLAAFIRGQHKRGKTMMLVSILPLSVVIIRALLSS